MRQIIIVLAILFSLVPGAEAKRSHHYNGLVASINAQLARWLRPSGLCSGPEQIATLYGRGDGFLGKRVACREYGVLDAQRKTVAHRSLPCGTQVALTNPRNGLSTSATVSDRGPFTHAHWDLSPATGDALGMKKSEYLCVGGGLIALPIFNPGPSRKRRPKVETQIITIDDRFSAKGN